MLLSLTHYGVERLPPLGPSMGIEFAAHVDSIIVDKLPFTGIYSPSYRGTHQRSRRRHHSCQSGLSYILGGEARRVRRTFLDTLYPKSLVDRLRFRVPQEPPLPSYGVR